MKNVFIRSLCVVILLSASLAWASSTPPAPATAEVRAIGCEDLVALSPAQRAKVAKALTKKRMATYAPEAFAKLTESPTSAGTCVECATAGNRGVICWRVKCSAETP